MDFKMAGIFYIMITFLLFNEMLVNVHARNNRISKTRETAVGLRKNICDITDRDPKVHCYCENNRESQNVTMAQCWVFNGDIASDDPIWKSFASQPNLQSLSFNIRVDGSLRYVPTKTLSNLQRLKSINIIYANIEDVTPFSFANMTNLEETLLSQNQIKTLQQYAFAYLPNITMIDLEDNKIIQIDSEAFVELPKLQKLIFTQNNISIIQNGTFQHTFNLLELDLNKNNIYNLNRRTFDGLANLRKLDLRENRIQILANFTFAELWNLQELLLGKNDLRYISERAFDGMSELRTLSLYENKLASLPSRLFQGVRGVTFLNLRSNELHVLTFDHIKPIIENLRHRNSSLFLEENNFECDCRLKWVHELRTNTKSQFTKDSLDGVTCKMDHPIVNSAYNQRPELNPQVDYNQEILHAGNKIDNLNEKINVNEKKTIPIPGQMVNTGIKGTSKKLDVTVLKISPKSLPCPREIKETTETPLMSLGYPIIPIQNKKETSSTHGLKSMQEKRRLGMLVYCIMSLTFFLT